MILGIDEVGRGPWAGPLVVGAVVLGGVEIPGLTDSKKLSKKRREELDVVIRQEASGIGLGWVTAGEIDEIGLAAALKLATVRAVEQIKTPYHEIIIDGTINFLQNTNKEKFVSTMKKADLLVPCVSAASIVAKVARDAYMTQQDVLYPGYGFKAHVGYGTAAHVKAIKELGITPLHRLSFAPLAGYRKAPPTAGFDVAESAELTSKAIGDEAENEAAQYLVRADHTIVARNWKTKFCEIDIISTFNGVVYFTEVKYRKKQTQGGGLAAITSKKLRQMKFAAQFYAIKNKLNDTDLRLTAISVTGSPPEVEAFLEIL